MGWGTLSCGGRFGRGVVWCGVVWGMVGCTALRCGLGQRGVERGGVGWNWLVGRLRTYLRVASPPATASGCHTSHARGEKPPKEIKNV